MAPALAALDKFLTRPHPGYRATSKGTSSIKSRLLLPNLTLTVDFVERRGFSHEQGIAFTLFARGVPGGELGRGGDYLISIAEGSAGEPACRVTLYMDSILRALPVQSPGATSFSFPHDTNPARRTTLQKEGWVTVAGLAKPDDAAEARRLGCTHILGRQTNAL